MGKKRLGADNDPERGPLEGVSRESLRREKGGRPRGRPCLTAQCDAQIGLREKKKSGTGRATADPGSGKHRRQERLSRFRTPRCRGRGWGLETPGRRSRARAEQTRTEDAGFAHDGSPPPLSGFVGNPLLVAFLFCRSCWRLRRSGKQLIDNVRNVPSTQLHQIGPVPVAALGRASPQWHDEKRSLVRLPLPDSRRVLHAPHLFHPLRQDHEIKVQHPEDSIQRTEPRLNAVGLIEREIAAGHLRPPCQFRLSEPSLLAKGRQSCAQSVHGSHP